MSNKRKTSLIKHIRKYTYNSRTFTKNPCAMHLYNSIISIHDILVSFLCICPLRNFPIDFLGPNVFNGKKKTSILCLEGYMEESRVIYHFVVRNVKFTPVRVTHHSM